MCMAKDLGLSSLAKRNKGSCVWAYKARFACLIVISNFLLKNGQVICYIYLKKKKKERVK